MTLHDVLKKHPTLTDNGWSNPRDPQFADHRASLLSHPEDVERARVWLAVQPKTCTPRPWAHSYRLKHMCEDVTGAYLSNGALIAAAILEGLRVERYDGSLNCCMNLRKPRKATP